MSDREKSKKVGPKKRKQQFSSTSSDDSDAKQSSNMAEKKTKMGFDQKLQMRIADHLRKNTQKVISQYFYSAKKISQYFSFRHMWISMKSVDFYMENFPITNDTNTNSSTKLSPLPTKNCVKK